jgi:hypothetical protein
MDNNKSQRVPVSRNLPEHVCRSHCACENGACASRVSNANQMMHGGADISSTSTTSTSATNSNVKSGTTTTSSEDPNTNNAPLASSDSETDNTQDFEEQRIYLTDVKTSDLYMYRGGAPADNYYDGAAETDVIDAAVNNVASRQTNQKRGTAQANLEKARGDLTGPYNDAYTGLETPNQPTGSTSSDEFGNSSRSSTSFEDLRTNTPRGVSGRSNRKTFMMQ